MLRLFLDYADNETQCWQRLKKAKIQKQIAPFWSLCTFYFKNQSRQFWTEVAWVLKWNYPHDTWELFSYFRSHDLADMTDMIWHPRPRNLWIYTLFQLTDDNKHVYALLFLISLVFNKMKSWSSSFCFFATLSQLANLNVKFFAALSTLSLKNSCTMNWFCWNAVGVVSCIRVTRIGFL